MDPFAGTLQQKLRSSSIGFLTLLLKIGSGLVLGLTLALIGEQALNYGTLSFFFVLAVATLTFVRIVKSWTSVSVLVFDLIMVLIGLLVRMYILVAPGG